MSFKYILTVKGIEIPVMTIIGFLIVFIWAIGMVIAPLTLPPNSVEDLTPDEEDKSDSRWGVGATDNEDITKDMNPYAKFYYEAGDSQCHQIKERSFFINGNQMPFCSRDVAIFLGMALGMGIVLFIRFPIKLWWVIGGLIPIGLDGGLQLITSYESNNLFRVLTGGLAGVITMLALGFVLYDVSKDAQMKSMFIKEAQENPDPNPYPELNENQLTVPENMEGLEEELREAHIPGERDDVPSDDTK